MAVGAPGAIRVSGPLPVPRIAPASALALRGKAHEIICARAYPSTAGSVGAFVRHISEAAPESLAGYPGLGDALAPYMEIPPPAARAGSIAKARKEFAAYSRMADRAPPLATSSESEFVAILLELHRRLGAGANAFRTHAVSTAPDGAGNRVVFPHFRHCPALIRDLHGFLAANLAHHPSLCAVVAYVGVNHAHPFSDGNGRTARTLYNLIMTASGSRHFLPIHCVGRPTRGSLILKTRRAMYDGDWEPLLAFFTDATRLSDRLQRQAAA